MYHLKRLVISVGLSNLDEEVVRYASIVSQIMDADTVYFVHVAEMLKLPKEKQHQDVQAPVDETIRQEIQRTVDKYFPEQDATRFSIDILEGKPTDELIRYVKRKDADLFILAKPDEQSSKINLGKLAELSSCSVLLVPERADIKIEKIAVALDFSEHAKMALEQALKFAEEGENVRVYGFHVYQIPHGYSKTGKSYEEFKRIMEKNAKKEAEQFFKQYHLSDTICEMGYQLSEDARIDDELFSFAEEKEVDLLVVGSRGRTAAASILLGSVAERLVHYKNNIPLFFVKDKNSNMSFLEALFRL